MKGAGSFSSERIRTVSKRLMYQWPYTYLRVAAQFQRPLCEIARDLRTITHLGTQD